MSEHGDYFPKEKITNDHIKQLVNKISKSIILETIQEEKEFDIEQMDISNIRRGKSSSVKQPVKQKTFVDNQPGDIPVRTTSGQAPSLSKTKTSVVEKSKQKQVPYDDEEDYSNDFDASNSFSIKPAAKSTKPKNPLDLFQNQVTQKESKKEEPKLTFWEKKAAEKAAAEAAAKKAQEAKKPDPFGTK